MEGTGNDISQLYQVDLNKARLFTDSSRTLAGQKEGNNDLNIGQSTKKGKRIGNSVRAENAVKRMKGEEYIGYSRIVDPSTLKVKTPQDKHRDARKMGDACSSNECLKSKNRHCSSFSVADRQKLFQEFWSLGNWEEKKTYVRSLVDQKMPHRSTKIHVANGLSTRNTTYLFHLKQNGLRRQVCRAMFVSTLGVGSKQIRNWLTKPSVSCNRRNSKGGSLQFAKDYLDMMPKLQSHYCRKDTKKFYLEPIVRSKQHLYDLYVEKCKDCQECQVARSTFMSLVDKKKIGIFQPKKDQCDTCCAKNSGNLSQEEYDIHIQKKESAREEKSKDKTKAIEGNGHVLTMDVQKVLLSPMINASALYYKTKLMVHNFTIFDLATSDVMCYVWDETHAELVASVFATCLLLYMDNKFKDNQQITVFSDGCTYQNRNAILLNALLHYSVKHKKVIIQKYLEKGHTQMEVDSVHAKIETRLEGQQIHLPTDYLDICKNARKNGGYAVTPRTFDLFKDFTVNKAYKSIRPGSKKIDPHVTDIRQLKYNPDGSLEYKLDHQEDWRPFPRRYRVDPNTIFPPLYSERQRIAKRKYDDLQELLHVLPPECHQFYKSLPYK